MQSNTGHVDVFNFNLISALNQIQLLAPTKFLITVDTEFPGDPMGTDNDWKIRGRRQEAYQVMKRNVNATNMITLGISLSDYNGMRDAIHTFHFNMRFDLDREVYEPASIEFLREHGIDFERLKEEGCDQKQVVDGLRILMCDKNRKWISFHGCKDQAYLIKLLTGCNLPERVEDFLQLVEFYFPFFYDLKYLVTQHKLLSKVSGFSLEKLMKHYHLIVPENVHNSGVDAAMTTDLYIFLKGKLKNFRFYRNRFWSLAQ